MTTEDEPVNNDVQEVVIEDIATEAMEVSEEVSFGTAEDVEIEELEDIEDDVIEGETVSEDIIEDDLIQEDVMDEEFDDTELETSSVTEEVVTDNIEDDGFDELASDEELLADIIAREIQIDISDDIDELIEDKEEELEEYAEEIADASEENVEQTEEIAEDSTEEEDSEAAEFEVQESNSIMFDLKEEFAEDNSLEEVEETVEATADEAEAEENEEEIEIGEVAEEKADSENSEADEVAKVEEKQQQKTAPTPRGSIQSETAKEELKNFIARFSGVQGLDKQILKVMQTTLKVEKSPVKFIFVKGEVKSGKTTLAIEVLKLANKIMQRRDQKIAKIKAESINGKSIDGLLSKLDGSDVLIERVSDMQPDKFVEFIDKLNAEGRERFVIFEDEKSLADAFLEKIPESHREFANVLDIKQNRIKDWTKMASDYAKKQGYTFDEMGTLALSAKIDQLRAITLVVHKNHVEQLVDGAIKNYNKFSFGKLFRKFTEKNEDGLKVLTEKDFMD